MIELHQKHLLPVSRKRFNWPILKSPHPFFSQDEQKILSTLDVGKKSGRNLDKYSKWPPHGKIARLIDELLWWADYCKQKPARSGPVIILPSRSIYDDADYPLVATLRKHLEPRELEVARLEPLDKNSREEWGEFMRALLNDCFNDRHCAEFLARGFVTAESRKQEHG